MAISLRRALISSRNALQTLRATSLHYHHQHSLSSLDSSHPRYFHQSAHVDAFLKPPTETRLHLFDIRRGFAKGRKQQMIKEEEEEEEEEDENKDEEEAIDLGASIKGAASQMEAAVDALSRELAKLRTGRASPGMLDHIMVEHYGVKTPLNRMAVVSVMDPKTLSVTAYDPDTLKELEKAIISSPLGLNPQPGDQRLIVPIPPLTKEHMQAVCKLVAKSAEDVKQSIRRARQKALDSIKSSMKKTVSKKKDKDKADKDKAGSSKKGKDKADKDKAGPSISVDDVKRIEKEIDDLTKKFIKTAEDLCKAKEKEITAG